MEHFLENANPFTHYNAILFQDMTPLILCCQYGLLDKIKLLLNNPMVDLNARNNAGETALHLGVVSGNVEVIKILGARKDLVWNAVDKEGRPAHFLALMDGNFEILQLMMSYETAIDWNIKMDGHPLIHLNLHWRSEVLLERANQRVTPKQRMALFRLLLRIPTLDWNAKDPYGYTLLGLAMDREDVTMMLFLFETPRLDYDMNQLSLFPLITKDVLQRCLDRLAREELTHVFSEAVRFLEAAKENALDAKVMMMI